ncbi:MAG: hypothetical protein GEU93_13400 [Propionibacteriales bacterium]|nr:hypothetical protein [Propionibacteriales bacterium]
MKRSERWTRTVTNHRRVVILAAVLAFAGIWIAVGAGEWRIGVFVGVGVLLGLANLLLTEFSLQVSIESDGTPNRKQFALSSLMRLLGITAVALGFTVLFWPLGATVLIGLSAFHLLTLVLTGIPLLKELRKV